ncbi:MAG: hypothetical protein ABIB11_05380 [Candidatus Omnitrophota bacterium]
MLEIFVFGAGASHVSGQTPLGKDLVWRYYDDFSPWSRIELSDVERKERYEQFKCFKKFLERIEIRFPELHVIAKKFDDTIKIDGSFDPDVKKPYYIDEIMERFVLEDKYREDIQLIRKLTAEHIYKASLSCNNLFYRRFVKSLKDKSKENVSIISFNFDCLLKDDLDEKIFFDYCIDFDEIDSRRCFYKSTNGIQMPLLKLHGSLDWKFNRDSITLLPTEWYAGLGGEPHIFLAHEKAVQKMKNLWNYAARNLQLAERITFIGYSLPLYDKDATKLFKDNVRNGVIIKVVDKSKDTYNRFAKLFDKQKMEFVECDIKNFVLETV